MLPPHQRPTHPPNDSDLSSKKPPTFYTKNKIDAENKHPPLKRTTISSSTENTTCAKFCAAPSSPDMRTFAKFLLPQTISSNANTPLNILRNIHQLFMTGGCFFNMSSQPPQYNQLIKTLSVTCHKKLMYIPKYVQWCVCIA